MGTDYSSCADVAALAAVDGSLLHTWQADFRARERCRAGVQCDYDMVNMCLPYLDTLHQGGDESQRNLAKPNEKRRSGKVEDDPTQILIECDEGEV